MTPEEAIEKLDEIDDGDAENVHIVADEILLEYIPQDVRNAYNRVKNRVGGFWYA